jgi:hypothetical protein
MHLLLLLALAHIDVIAPRCRSAMVYSSEEGLNIIDYLESLMRVKFAKGLHRIWPDEDDDNDEDDPAALDPEPIAPGSSAGS